MEGRMGEEPPTPGDLTKLEAAVCVRVLGCQVSKGLRGFARGNAEHPRSDEVLVALAGPASNILQACIGTGLFNLVWGAIERSPGLFSAGPVVFGYTPMALILSLFSTYVWINLTLAFFNLIPFPPLDGSKVLCYFLKGETLRRYYQIQNYAMPILLVLLYALPKLGLDPVGAYLEFTAGGLYNLLMGV